MRQLGGLLIGEQPGDLISLGLVGLNFKLLIRCGSLGQNLVR